MKALRYSFLFIAFILCFNFNTFSQNREDILKSMSLKDKIWAAKNYSSIKKAEKISLKVLSVMDSLDRINFLGGNKEGGVFDAFRHIYWMYSLSKEIGEKKAERIGIIYENYNKYLFYEKGVNGYDSVGMVMDLFNNDLGINLSKEEISDSLVFNKITNIILQGKAKIVKKNTLQQSLDENDNVILDEEWKKSWINNRRLVNSDYNLK